MTLKFSNALTPWKKKKVNNQTAREIILVMNKTRQTLDCFGESQGFWALSIFLMNPKKSLLLK